MGDSPAVARRRVRLALRNAREAKGLTQTQVAEAMEWSLSKVLRIESGEVTISAGDLRMLMPYLDIKDPAEADRLIGDARASRRQRWSITAKQREHLSVATIELMQLELEATAVRYFNPILMPGLLQTPSYASALFRVGLPHVTGLDNEKIQTRVNTRLQRKERVLGRSNPPRYLAILDESVLYREMGGPQVMAEQLHELLRMMHKSNVNVRIIPFSAPVGMLGPFTILDMGDEQDAVLYRETDTGDEIVRVRREIISHREWFERLWAAALSDEESIRLVRSRAQIMSDVVQRTGEVH